MAALDAALHAFARRSKNCYTKSMTNITAKLDAAAAACTQHGTQLTALRRSVLELILQAESPLTAYQLLDRLKTTHKNAAPPTIYRALEFLRENDLIHKIERLSAFVPCIDATHHGHPAQFLICRTCGTVAELEDHAIANALNAAAAAQKFTPAHALVEIEGLCGACASRETAR